MIQLLRFVTSQWTSNSHCWQQNNKYMYPWTSIEKRLLGQHFYAHHTQSNTTIHCYTSFQSNSNPQPKSRPQPTRPDRCVRAACVRRVSFVCQQIQQKQWGGWKWTSRCGTERGDGFPVPWTRYYTNDNCLIYSETCSHKKNKQKVGTWHRLIPSLLPHEFVQSITTEVPLWQSNYKKKRR
jgi:hypothetical protein